MRVFVCVCVCECTSELAMSHVLCMTNDLSDTVRS